MIYFLFWPVWLAGFLLGLWEKRGSIRCIVPFGNTFCIITPFLIIVLIWWFAYWCIFSPLPEIIPETKPVITMQNQQDGRDSLIALSSEGIYAAYSPTSPIPILSQSIASATTILSFVVSESYVTIDGGSNIRLKGGDR